MGEYMQTMSKLSTVYTKILQGDYSPQNMEQYDVLVEKAYSLCGDNKDKYHNDYDTMCDQIERMINWKAVELA